MRPRRLDFGLAAGLAAVLLFTRATGQTDPAKLDKVKLQGEVKETLEKANLPSRPGLPGRYVVAYEDAQFGEVRGVAEIVTDLYGSTVTLENPKTKQEHRLVASRITRDGRNVTMVLEGRSPSAESAPAKPPDLSTMAVLHVGKDAKEVRATARGATSTVPVGPTPLVDLDRVTLNLELADDNSLSGTWSYFADPSTHRDRKGGGRAARFGTVDVAGRPQGVQYGAEAWRKIPPTIAGVVVLEDQTGGIAPGVPAWTYPFVPNRPPGWTSRTLFVYGLGLPTTYTEARDFTSSDPTLTYYVKYLRADAQRADRPIFDFERGWKQALEHASKKDRDALSRMDALIVDVRMERGILPGPKDFTLNGASAGWTLLFGDNVADIRFVRRIGPDSPAGPKKKFESGTEDTPDVFVQETIQVEVRTAVALPIESVPLILGCNDKVLKNDGDDYWTAFRVEGSRDVFRTTPIRLVGRMAPEKQRLPGLHYLEVAEGDILLARLGSADLLLTRKQSDETSRGLAAIAHPEARKLYDAKARVVQAPARIGGFWKETLKRAADCKGIPVENWDALPEAQYQEISHRIYHQAKVRDFSKSLYEATIHADPGKVVLPVPPLKTVEVTVGDVAAMVLLRDEFVRLLKDLKQRIPEIKTDTDLRAFRDTFGPHMDDPQFPLTHIEVPGPNTAKIDPRLRALGKAGFGGLDVVSTVDVYVPYSFAFDEDYGTDYFRRYFRDDRAAARRWSDDAVRKGLAIYRSGIDAAIARAEGAGDCDTEELIEITGLSFEPIEALLTPKLMRLEGAPGKEWNWTPDRDAREAIAGVSRLAGEVKNLEALQDTDIALIVAAVSVATMPLMLSESVLAAAIMLAADAGDLTYTSITSGWEYYESKQEVAFATGAAEILGPDRLDEAKKAEASALGVALEVGLSALGTAADTLDLAEKMRRASGMKALGRIREEGVGTIQHLSSTEAKNVREVLDEIRRTPTDDLSDAQKNMKAFYDDLKRRQGLDLLAVVDARIRPGPIAAGVPMPLPPRAPPTQPPAMAAAMHMQPPPHAAGMPPSPPPSIGVTGEVGNIERPPDSLPVRPAPEATTPASQAAASPSPKEPVPEAGPQPPPGKRPGTTTRTRRRPEPAPGSRADEPTIRNAPAPEPARRPAPRPAPSEIPAWARERDRNRFVNAEGELVHRGDFLAEGGFARVHLYDTTGGDPSSVAKFVERQALNREEAAQVVDDGRTGSTQLAQDGIRQVEDLHYEPDADIPWYRQRRVGFDLPEGVYEEKLWKEVREVVGKDADDNPIYRVQDKYQDGMLDTYIAMMKKKMIGDDIKGQNLAWQRIDDPKLGGPERWTTAIFDGKDRVGHIRNPETGPEGMQSFLEEVWIASENRGRLKLRSQKKGDIRFTSAEQFMVLEMERKGLIRYDPKTGTYVDGQLSVQRVKDRMTEAGLNGDIDRFITEVPAAAKSAPHPPKSAGETVKLPAAEMPEDLLLTEKLPQRYLPGGSEAHTVKYPTENLPGDMPTLRLEPREVLPAEEAWRRVDEAGRRLAIPGRRDLATLVGTDPEGLNRLVDEFGADEVAETLRWEAHDSVGGLESALRRRRERVDAPREGLYDGIHPDHDPPDWKLDHRPGVDEDTGLPFQTTAVEGPGVNSSERGKATFTRSYDEANKTFIFNSAIRKTGEPAHPWMRTPGQPELVPGKGTPTSTYVTLEQMRQWEIEPGSLREFQWKNVINLDSALHMAWLRRHHPDLTLEEMFRRSDSFKYGETAITQSGHVVDSLKVEGEQWMTVRDAVKEYALDDEAAEALVRRYGLDPDDPVPIGFTAKAKTSLHPELPPRTASVPSVPPAPPPPAMAHVADPVPRDADLFIRTPGSAPNPAYLANAREAAQEFGDAVAGGRAQLMSGERLRDVTDEMHRIIAEGKTGRTPSRTDVVYPGRARDELTVKEGRNKGFVRDEAEEYLAHVQKQVPGIHLNWRRPTAIAPVPLPIEGIPARALPRNTPGGGHAYPPAEALDLYFERGAELLAEIDALPAGSPEALEKIARYYHLMVNAAPFPQINNSIFMTQVNHLLRAKGVSPGLPHGYIDHLAYQLELADFLEVFRLHLEGKLPEPSKFGLTISRSRRGRWIEEETIHDAAA